MANDTQSQQLFNKIDKLINSSRNSEAFLLLKKNMQYYPNLQKELEKLKLQESTYRYMLDYLSEGNQDPSSKETLIQIKEALTKANDLLLREALLKDSSELYYSSQRMFSLRNTSLQSLFENFEEALKTDNEEDDTQKISPLQSKTLSEIFNYLWTKNQYEEEDYKTLFDSFDKESYPDYIKALLISAIVLANISYFNADSFEILLNQYENTDSLGLKARILTGIVLISLLYPNRISGNLKLKSHLMLSSEDEEFHKVVNEIIFNIIRTYDTKRIDDKMRNEVIPGLMKIKPEIIDKMRNLASDSEDFLSDINPQWEELLEESEIGDKIKEINDMQLEGADVMVTAFSNLKSFPFFSLVSNWFLPFSPGYYEFRSLPIHNDKETIERLTTVMCDSDLHSFLLSMGTMPSDRRNQILSNMQLQMKEAYNAMNNSIGITSQQKLTNKIKHTLQDLYRFFKFYPKRSEFKDPFASPFLALNIETLIPILGITPETIKLISEFYFKNKYYVEALGFFELLDKEEPGNFSLWEKIGFCYDMLHQYDKASQWYKKALLVNPGNKWLEKKLAIALKNAGHPQEALEYYELVLSKEPENYHLLMSAGQCFLMAQRYDEALKQFYHAQYLKPEKIAPKRAIAWAELLSGNLEKAKNQYQKLLQESDADKNDFLNAAHAALAREDFRNALKLYKSFVELSDNRDITALVLAFRDDNEIIRQLGIKVADLRLIVDKIRYDFIS